MRAGSTAEPVSTWGLRKGKVSLSIAKGAINQLAGFRNQRMSDGQLSSLLMFVVASGSTSG